MNWYRKKVARIVIPPDCKNCSNGDVLEFFKAMYHKDKEKVKWILQNKPAIGASQIDFETLQKLKTVWDKEDPTKAHDINSPYGSDPDSVQNLGTTDRANPKGKVVGQR